MTSPNWNVVLAEAKDRVRVHEGSVTILPNPDGYTRQVQTLAVFGTPFSSETKTHWTFRLKNEPFIFQCGLFAGSPQDFLRRRNASSRPTSPPDSLEISADNCFRNGLRLTCPSFLGEFQANVVYSFCLDPVAGRLEARRSDVPGCAVMPLSLRTRYTFFVHFWQANTVKAEIEAL